MAGLGQSLRELLRLLGAHETSANRTARHWLFYKEAEECGDRLLSRNLSPVQREQYETRGYFDVVGGDSGNRYRIWHGYSMNVEQLDKFGRWECHLCFTPAAGLPVGDVMLAQKLALELFETEAIRVARRSLAPME